MVHQPHFLPWSGYLARCLSADVFVVLDNVKFNHNHFQQRTKFIDRNSQLRWLSLPIDRDTRSELISEVRIASDFYFKKWQRPFVESYRDSPLFEEVWNVIAEIISKNRPSFCGVTLDILDFLFNRLSDTLLQPRIEVVRASQIPASVDRTVRLIDICRNQGVTHLVMGSYALQSHDINRLSAAGLLLLKQTFVGELDLHPTPGVTGLHYIVRNGWAVAATQLRSQWALQPVFNGGGD